METKPIPPNQRGSYYGKKIGEIKGHDIYLMGGKGVTIIRAFNQKTNLIDMFVDGIMTENPDNSRTFQIDKLSGREGTSLKAHELYHYLINHHNVILNTSSQSLGGYKVWQKLSRKRDINVHGYYPQYVKYANNFKDIKDLADTAVPVDMKEPEENLGPPEDKVEEPEDKQFDYIKAMELVASKKRYIRPQHYKDQILGMIRNKVPQNKIANHFHISPSLVTYYKQQAGL
jgi:hypothetical protein